MKSYTNHVARCVATSKDVSICHDVKTNASYSVMNDDINKFVLIPSSLMDGKSFRVGAVVHLCGIHYDDGVTRWVPDQREYTKITANNSFNFGTENCSKEFKRSLIHIADRDKDVPQTGNKPAQFKVIAREIAGMVTAKSPNAEIIIGCDDNGYPVGLNDEVSNITVSESELRNYLSQCFGNVSFVSQLIMKWENIDGKLILRIQIPEYNGDILLVSQTEVYLRNGSNTNRIKGSELINLIRYYKS